MEKQKWFKKADLQHPQLGVFQHNTISFPVKIGVEKNWLLHRIWSNHKYCMVHKNKICWLPSSGGSQKRSIALMSESLTPSTLKRPPWTTKTFSFITWAKGKQQNTSAKSSTNFSLNFDLTSPSKPYILFMLLLSWFPRARCIAENFTK